jgi:hypothetical protein
MEKRPMPSPRNEIAAERFAHQASQPFQPLQPKTMSLDTTALRIAHALEYIAAQLGQVNAKLDKLMK